MNCLYPNKTDFNKNREIVLERSGGLCERCGEKADAVHHVDGQKVNHEVENLKAVCHKCHGKEHKEIRRAMDIEIPMIDIDRLDRIIKIRGYTKTMIRKQRHINMIHIYKRKKANPTTLKKLADILECEVEDILTDEYMSYGPKAKDKEVNVAIVASASREYKKILIEINKLVLENIEDPESYLEREISQLVKKYLISRVV
jgi:DNA-binding Xre family transcriptional regulator